MKSNSRFRAWTLIIASGFATLLNAQNAAKQPVPVKASVGDVTDHRSTGSFNSDCKLELKFTGDAASDAASVRRIRVKTAIDELGRDLTRHDSQDSAASAGSSQRSGVLKTEVRLRNPSRNATAIKLVEGEVEFFNPTSVNGGILVIKDILKQ